MSGIVEFCPECDRETIQKFVHDDGIFKLGLECMECHTIWEADSEYSQEDND